MLFEFITEVVFRRVSFAVWPTEFRDVSSRRGSFLMFTQIDSQSSWLPVRSLTVRLGLFWLLLLLGLNAIALWSIHSGSPQHQRYYWLASLIVVGCGALYAMRTSRNLATFEAELSRVTAKFQAVEDPEQALQAARPIVGAHGASRASITAAWNLMVEHCRRSNDSGEANRQSADLDQEAVTLARAMRGMPMAWAVTDLQGNLQHAGPALHATLGRDADMSFTQDASKKTSEGPSPGKESNLLEMLELSGEAGQELCQKLLSPLRIVTAKVQLNDQQEDPTHLRITRSRLSGRDGDAQGLAWIIEDTTQQTLAIEARDNFLMTATHELRTPLANLTAYAETLVAEEDIDAEDRKEFCNTINAEAHRLARLVDQLLAVSQMEAGAMVIHRLDVDLATLLYDSIDESLPTAQSKGLQLNTEIAAKLPPVRGDRDKLHAVLVNLIGNAIKYTVQGSVTVRATSDDQWIIIDVEDTGLGIAEDDIPHVFEKFYRCNNEATQAMPGNGLGLSFAYEITRLHGGDLTVESQQGEGSRFRWTLPVGGIAKAGV